MINRRSMIAGVAGLVIAGPALAANRAVIDNRVKLALEKLYATLPDSRDLAARSRGMLVMPSVLKGGFILGGAYGEGALLTGGTPDLPGPASGYYSVASASLGLQLGVQTTSHVLFFMTDAALERFRRAKGWEIGADAEVTWPGRGLTAQTDSTSMNEPVIGIVFGQDGLLVGASLEGAKYSPIAP